MTQTLLSLSAVSLEIGGRLLLERVDLKLDRGEILTIVGPNGAGKTTLLRVALGLQKPTGGKVAMTAGLTIGYMPQKLHLDATFPISVKRFMDLATVRGKGAAIARLLGEVGVEHVLETPLQNLSGGELQRVLLARAMVREPDILVLDEPVQGVDVHGQTELYRLIARIRDQHGCAILMVSHDLHLVMAATDRVLCLNRHICCSGTPEAVTSDPAYVELFGQHAVDHLAVYIHDQNHQHDQCCDCDKRQHCEHR